MMGDIRSSLLDRKLIEIARMLEKYGKEAMPGELVCQRVRLCDGERTYRIMIVLEADIANLLEWDTAEELHEVEDE